MLIAISARMSSSRLPGKPLLKLNGKNSIQRLVDKANKIISNDKIFVLTSTLTVDNEIVNYCQLKKINYRRGHPIYVLKRLINLAKEFPKEEKIALIGSDCPLMDFEFFENLTNYLNKKNLEKYELITSYFPNTFPAGIEFNIVSKSWLLSLDLDDLHNSELEHCFNKLLLSKKRNKVLNIKSNTNLSMLNFSLDTKDDFNYIENILHLNPKHTISDLIKTIIKNEKLILETKKRIQPFVENAFISSKGMHASIESKIIDTVRDGFDAFNKNNPKKGIKKLNEASEVLNGFTNNKDIKQLTIKSITKDLFENFNLALHN